MTNEQMSHIKVSICVPIYGTEKYIQRCAISLFEQTYPYIEYIFVNDCTKDASIIILNDILNRYPQKKVQTKILSHTYNRGLAASRLTGLENASGDYIWFVDSDDYVEIEAIEKCIQFLKDKPDLLIFNYISEYSNTKIKSNVESVSVNDILTFRVSPSIWKCIIKKDIFFKYNIYPIEGINFSEDLLLLGRLIIVSNRIVVLKDHFFYHYFCNNPNSYMGTISLKSRKNLIECVLLLLKFYKSLGCESKYKKGLLFLLADSYFSFALHYGLSNPIMIKAKMAIKDLSFFVYIITRISIILKSKILLKIYKSTIK